MATYDRTQLAELRALVIAMSDDIEDARAHGYSVPYSGEDLRRYYRALVRSHGLEITLQAARRRYDLQLLGVAPPLQEPAVEATKDGSSCEPGGAA